MGIRDLLAEVATGDMILINGDDGQVIVNPAPERMVSVNQRIQAIGATKVESSLPPASLISRTKDGTAISLRANTEMLRELGAAKRCGAEGVGLFRSEFLYFGHPQGFPGMEEQLAAYRRLAKEMNPHPVAIRTLDAGSEQISEGPHLARQENPSMGLRGIRLSLHSRDAFCTQIEAILRASGDGRIEIVLPMISTIEEIWEARALIEKTRSRLSGIPGLSVQAVPIGAMIEVPAAVISLEMLAKEVDFLCVGTNDLIQYLLAVDRGNPHVAYLFQPLHPSVLSCLDQIGRVARKLKKPVRICGEISSNPFYAVLLLGMGFTQLSMNPLSIPAIRRIIRELSIDVARPIAQKALSLITVKEVYEYVTDAVSKLVSWDLSSYAKEIAPQNGRNHK
jgi:phosphotransferase system enzyme I (PtsI)